MPPEVIKKPNGTIEYWVEVKHRRPSYSKGRGTKSSGEESVWYHFGVKN